MQPLLEQTATSVPAEEATQSVISWRAREIMIQPITVRVHDVIEGPLCVSPEDGHRMNSTGHGGRKWAMMNTNKKNRRAACLVMHPAKKILPDVV